MAIRNKRIVVTGGAGFIGSNLVESLAKGNEIVIIDNMHTGSVKNLKGVFDNDVTLVRKDVRRINELRFSPDIIFHLGMYSSTPMYRENNYRVGEVVNGAISVMTYAAKTGADVVFASSSSIYNGYRPPHRESMVPKVTDFYTEARITVERLAELYSKLDGTNATGLRFFSVYGKHEESKRQYANLVSQFIWSIKKGQRPVVYGDGSQTRDFTYVADVVSALHKGASQRGFNIYNVGTGRTYSLNQLLKKLATHTGRNIRARYIKTPIKNYVMYTQADTRKAASELGFRAKYSLDDGIKELVEYYGV